jgi:predicted DNA-binding transcriptional regulator YafY
MGSKKRERLAHIMEVLSQQGRITAQELATNFGSSRRTVYRYMETLKRQGVGVEACPGSHGGFRLSPPDMSKLLTSEEYRALLMAACIVAEHNLLPYGDHLATAMDKVKQSLSAEQWREVRDTMPDVSVYVGQLADYERLADVLEQLTVAIADKAGIVITYYALHRDSEQNRQIDPYHLFHQGGAWYVAGYCHWRKDVRTFRVDRIRALEREDRTFVRPKNFSLDRYLGCAWSMMRGERQNVVVKFFPPASRLVAETAWHRTQKITSLPDGTILFSADVDGLDEIMRWVLTYGDCAEVISPPELRAAITERLLGAAARYSSTDPSGGQAEQESACGQH